MRAVPNDNAGMQFDVSGDDGKDRIELYETWDKVRVFGGSGTDTLKKRGIGPIEPSGIDLQE